MVINVDFFQVLPRKAVFGSAVPFVAGFGKWCRVAVHQIVFTIQCFRYTSSLRLSFLFFLDDLSLRLSWANREAAYKPSSGLGCLPDCPYHPPAWPFSSPHM